MSDVVVLDTSAIVAHLWGERDRRWLPNALEGKRAFVSTMTLLELHLVLSRDPRHTSRAVENLLLTFGIVPAPFDLDHLTAAREAFDRFGKGRHPAALNFGDCAAYAVARTLGAGLLYVGSDFALTDAAPAG